ncbi:S-layer homology domain-containing protein [Peribacillus butanolivorans]|uniref:S-layer homology domain-containing protein n=1 Tax=Peribacillus butanolivorans TaxID=421767 RepID=UPI0036B84778
MLHSFSRCKYVRSRYYDVQALYDAGIIRGVSATKFNPYGTLTRQQAALMLVRTLELGHTSKTENVSREMLVERHDEKIDKVKILY